MTMDLLSSKKALILDTETHGMNGLPIEIAYTAMSIHAGQLEIDQAHIFDQLYQVDQPISYGAMAVHHILESDLVGMPHYTEFRLPAQTEYLIGHNIDYDIQAIARCGVDVSSIKAICTLALARKVWPDAEAHNLSALIYMVSKGSSKARELLKGAHRADADIILTANVLAHLLHHLQGQGVVVNDLEQLYQQSEQARIPSKINFGKHRGTAIADLPSDYVHWLLKQDQLDPYLKKALTQQL